MEIQSSQKYCIITPLSPKIDCRETRRIQSELESNSNLIIGMDLSFVEDCTVEFIETLKEFKAACFNIPAEIFALINIMNLDKTIPLYATQEDFEADKHRILNRKFTLV